jgi:SAM-dependent methyltransferase
MRSSPATTVVFALTIAVAGVGCGSAVEEAASVAAPAADAEELVQHADPNARYYTPDGRAAAMGAFEADDREDWQMSPQIMEALHLEPGMMVAEVGAGTGYFTRQMASRVAPGGQVLAVDIIPEFLEELEARAEAAGIDNIETILGDLTDPKLPEDSVELIFLGDSYHHFGEPIPMLQHMRAALRRGGRMAIVDWERAPNPSFERSGLDWEAHIRLDSQGVIEEVTSNGFRLVEQPDFLEWQFYLIFERTD